MHKNYRFSKKQEGTVLITVGVNYVNLLNNPNVNPKNEDACKKNVCRFEGTIWFWQEALLHAPPLLQVASTLKLNRYGWQWKNPHIFTGLSL